MMKAKPIALAAVLSAGVAMASYSLAQQQAGQGAAQQSGQAGQREQSSGSRQQSGQQSQQQASEWDKDFVKHCHSNNQYEIQLGQFIQQQQDLDPQIKELAQRTAQDHQQADQQLQQVAQQIGAEWSNELNPVHRAKLDHFKQKKGDMLEKSYAFDQAGGHYKAVLEAQFMAQNSQNQPVKQYAQQSVSKLQHHLQMATRAAGGDMARLVSGEAGGASSQGQGQQGQQGQRSQQPGQGGSSTDRNPSTPGSSSGTPGSSSGGRPGDRSETSGGTSGSTTTTPR